MVELTSALRKEALEFLDKELQQLKEGRAFLKRSDPRPTPVHDLKIRIREAAIAALCAPLK